MNTDPWCCPDSGDGRHRDQPADDLNDGRARGYWHERCELCGSVVAIPV